MAIVSLGVPWGSFAFVLFGFRFRGEEPMHILVLKPGAFEAELMETEVKRQENPQSQNPHTSQNRSQEQQHKRNLVLS